MLTTDNLNIFKRAMSIFMDLITIVGSIFTFISYVHSWKYMSGRIHHSSVFISMVSSLLSGLIYLYANASFVFTANMKACEIVACISLILEMYTFMWPGAMAILSYLIIARKELSWKCCSGINNVFKVWFFAFHIIFVVYAFSLSLFFYFDNRYLRTGDWCWNVNEGSGGDTLFFNLIGIPFVEICTLVALILFNTLSYVTYKKTVVQSDAGGLIGIPGDIIDLKAYILIKSQRNLINATFISSGIAIFCFLVDTICSVGRSVVTNSNWPYVLNDFIAWLWGSMGFLMSISFVKPTWANWFRTQEYSVQRVTRFDRLR